MDQLAGLIGVLRDSTADVAERDDAAMDLANFDDPEALAALLQTGGDAADHDVVLASVGESIAEILLRRDQTWCPGVDDLAQIARVRTETGAS